MAGLGEAVAQAVGQPASIRVGTVDSVSPLVISAQGVAFEDVGVLAPFNPVVGMPVVLVGQSSQAGSDPASWLCLGSPQTAAALAQTQQATLATGYSIFNTAYAITANPLGIVFIAPPSGAVLIHWAARMTNTTAGGSCYSAPEIRKDGTIGSGALVYGASDNVSTRITVGDNTEVQRYGCTHLFDSLTSGEVYNVALLHKVDPSPTGAFIGLRCLIVQPV